MTPKSLLRHKLAVSSLQELASGAWQSIIPDSEIDVKKAKRVVLCSGKVYYDLLEQRRAQKCEDIALIRIEQLYPFPDIELTETLKHYFKVKDIVWCQEESKNQGFSITNDDVCRYSEGEQSAALPLGLKQLLERSANLYARLARLDGMALAEAA
jgi:2-oxoglutarate dehydrogenase E1 component